MKREAIYNMSFEWNLNGIFSNNILNRTNAISMQFVEVMFTIFFAILDSIHKPMEFLFTIHQKH